MNTRTNVKKKQSIVWTKKKILILAGVLLLVIVGLLINMKLASSKMSTDSQAAFKTGMIYESRRECMKHCKTRCTSSGCTGERFRCIALPSPKSLPSVYPTL